ncbi:MAG: M48 family metalloprotease [Streptosporangiales bacterium]|nr:M48 family metalloprotease [Streptosporangiales bacterium]
MIPAGPIHRRLDSGNRAFWLLVVAVFGFRGLVSILGCCVVCVVGLRLVTVGPAALLTGGGLMLPAVMLAALLVATTGTAGVRLARSLYADRTLRRELRARTHPYDPYDPVAARFGLAGRVHVVTAEEPFAFTHGLWTPRVVLSTGLVRTAPPAELVAVLAHESAHVRSRDPLKVLVAQVLLAREFYLPALRHLSSRFVAGRELAADRAAAAHCGNRPLAGALLRVLEPPSWAATTPAAAMASCSNAATLDARITQLETGSEPPPQRTPRRLLLASTLVAVLVLAAAVDAAILVQQMCMRAM